MFVVDTNVFVYALNLEAPQRKRAVHVIDEWRRGSEPWFATWPILYEFLRVVTHPNVFERPLTFDEAWEFVEGLFASRSFGILIQTERHPDMVQELAHEYPWIAGSILHDFHTVALMREHGILEIRTSDQGFRRFDHLRVVDPLRE